MPEQVNRKRFEEWYDSKGWVPHAVWHEKEQRYTIMSLRQTCWEVWCAATLSYKQNPCWSKNERPIT